MENEEVLHHPTSKYLLLAAVHHQALEVVKFLTNYSCTDLSLHRQYALRTAIAMQNEEIKNFLLDYQNIKESSILPLAGLNQVHVTWWSLPHYSNIDLPSWEGDAFSVKEPGISERVVAETWAKLLGLGKPICWEGRNRGTHRYVCFVPATTSEISDVLGAPFWDCKREEGTYPVIFSLVCEPN